MSIEMLKTTGVAGGRRLGYREDGKGAPVILLHGLGPGSQSWEHQVKGLRDQFRLIAWDMPGYGGSDPLPKETPTAADYAAELAAFMDSLSIQKAHVVGQSIGAIIAASFANHHASRILSVTLSGASSGNGTLDLVSREKNLKERLEMLSDNGPDSFAQISVSKCVAADTHPDTIEALTEHTSMISPEGYTPAVYMLINADIYSELSHIKAPTMVMCGTEDHITPEQSVRKISEQISGAKYRKLPGLGHCTFFEGPDMYNSALRQHLGGIQ